MKKLTLLIAAVLLLTAFSGCAGAKAEADILATTKPVYDFTLMLCQGTDLTVGRLINDNVSCLHDYTLQVSQMRAVEASELIVISGAGLEDFLLDLIPDSSSIIDASANIELLCVDEHHHDEHSDHSHGHDPHIWMSVENARKMTQNIFSGLTERFPDHTTQLSANLVLLNQKFDNLEALIAQELSALSCHDIITFHDGFSYLASSLNLNILRAIEEESGSEASASELKDLIHMVTDQSLPAIFTEVNGSTSAAHIISAETGVPIFQLNTCMSEKDYFSAMIDNINTLKEALG